MKEFYDRDSSPVTYEIGQKVWVYTPKNRRGLSKKLSHHWHGPYTIIAKTSPVNYVIRAADNSRISTTIHVYRLKPYTDPSARPIRQPPEDVDDPYLTEADLPPDSFAPRETTPVVANDDVGDPGADTPPPHDDSPSHDPLLDVFTAEKLLRQRMYKGKPQYKVKWKGYRETTWEPVENILDRSLLTKYYEDHPRAKKIFSNLRHL